jgi:hypothetical protein
MEEMQNNKNVRLEGFSDRVTGSMFPNHGEMELLGAVGSSPRAGRMPVIARRPSHMRSPLYGTAMMESNQLGPDFHDNGMFDDDLSLSSAFRRLCFRDDGEGGGGESLASPGSVAFRNGHCPVDIVIPSASRRVDTFHLVQHADDDFMHSSQNINDLEHLKPNSSVRNYPMYTGMHGLDDVSRSLVNLPSFSPLQQRLFVDGQPPAYPPYQQMDSNIRWRDTDAQGYPLVQSQYAYPQMPQVATSDVLLSRTNYSTMEAAAPSPGTPSVDQLGHHGADINWNVAVNPNGNSKMSFELLNNCNACSRGNYEYCHIQKAEKLDQYEIRCSLDEVGESIYLLAKDPKGSRFLQRIFDTGAPEYVTKVFYEIIGHIGELMVDPFGNHLVQKLLEECNNHQKLHITDKITKRPGLLIEVSCNKYGYVFHVSDVVSLYIYCYLKF